MKMKGEGRHMSVCDTSYDELLMQIQVYALHNELLTFVGAGYRASALKILFVAESHYVENCTWEDYKKARWYEQKLPPENPFFAERGAFDTRGVVKSWINDERKDAAYNVFRFPSEILMQNRNFSHCTTAPDVFHHVAFMNYYQRPSLMRGESILPDDMDKRFAATTLDEVINILKPTAVIFLSKTAYWEYLNHHPAFEKIYTVAHPCSPWWNRDKGRIGKIRLAQILEELTDNQA